MNSFKLSPESFERSKYKMILYNLIIITIVLFIILKPLISEDLKNKDSIFATIVVLVIVVIALIFRLNGQIKKQRAKWLSFEIIVDATKITRKQEGNPVVEIQKEQITEIKEAIGYGITIFTDNTNLKIFIPEALEKYDNLKSLLGLWSKIEVIKPKFRSSTATVYYVSGEVDKNRQLKKSVKMLFVGLIVLIILFVCLLLLVMFLGK